MDWIWIILLLRKTSLTVCLGFFTFLALALGRNDGFIAIEMIGSCVNHVHIDSDE